jgi:hypothetical protein
MELTTKPEPQSLAIRGNVRWPNVIVFPRELREAIPSYGARALVFDSVSGAQHVSPISVAWMIGEKLCNFGPRTRTELLVHETGKLDGQFRLLLDLDAATTRALGKFLVDLADRAEGPE